MPPSNCSNPLYDSVHGTIAEGPYDTIALDNPSVSLTEVSGFFASISGDGNIQESSSVAEKEDAL